MVHAIVQWVIEKRFWIIKKRVNNREISFFSTLWRVELIMTWVPSLPKGEVSASANGNDFEIILQWIERKQF